MLTSLQKLTKLFAAVAVVAASVSCAQVKYQGAIPGTGNGVFDAAPFPTNNNISPLYCSTGNGNPINVYPTQCLMHPAMPAGTIGFEMNNLQGKHFVLPANDQVKGTSQAKYIYIEIGTFVQPDMIVVNAVLSDTSKVQLVALCNVATYSGGDMTGGTGRPYSDTILQFTVQVPAGTRSLDFDFSQVASLTYIGSWNLNDFSTSLGDANTNPFGAGSQQFRVQSQPLSKYNDNADPAAGAPVCPAI